MIELKRNYRTFAGYIVTGLHRHPAYKHVIIGVIWIGESPQVEFFNDSGKVLNKTRTSGFNHARDLNEIILNLP